MKALEAGFLASGAELAESQRILAAVEACPAFQTASVVLAYMSMRGEVRTEDRVRRWSREKTVLLPLVVPDGLELRIYEEGKLAAGYAGIAEPSTQARLYEASAVEFAIVPGIAFAHDPSSPSKIWRMGRGKAFYDRLLPALHCPVAGVCFPFRVLDSIPVDPWDRPLDLLFY